MYLASVTTEDELNIVKGLLWGEGYQRNMTSNEEWIVTPCRMESDVCFIYIGLLVDDVSSKVPYILLFQRMTCQQQYHPFSVNTAGETIPTCFNKVGLVCIILYEDCKTPCHYINEIF